MEYDILWVRKIESDKIFDVGFCSLSILCLCFQYVFLLSAKHVLEQPCTEQTCTEMGMKAVLNPARGNFFVITSDQVPFCG